MTLSAPPGPPGLKRTATAQRPRPREIWLGWLDSPLTSYYLVLGAPAVDPPPAVIHKP